MHRLDLLARTPRLLIACDFDGTLAPIVPTPDQAVPSHAVLDALLGAAKLPQTLVTIVSGRAIDDLKQRLGDAPGLWLVGGHGAEIQGPNLVQVPDDVSLLLSALTKPMLDLAPPEKGFFHERKPTSIAVHYRAVDEQTAQTAVKSLIETVATPAGLSIKHGKMVIEFLAVDTDKGKALKKLIKAAGATGTLYIGDDVTDEDAFAVLGARDIAIKIAADTAQHTEADLIIETIEQAHESIHALIDARKQSLQANPFVPLQDHAILSDQRTIAVVAPPACINWLCAPRVDSGAVFASLLDGPSAGYWSIAPVNPAGPPTHQYINDTFTLETSWPGIRVLDYMDGSAGRSFQRAGRTDLVRVVEGSGEIEILFWPRPDFGRLKIRLSVEANGLIVDGPADPMVLVSPGVTWCLEERDSKPVAIARVHLTDQPLILELRIGTRNLEPSRLAEPIRRSQSERVWSSWAASLHLPPLATDLCKRSALVLRSLCYGPTGAILAAGTTSLPETAGGARNWDYRFCWPRDAAIAAAALVRLGNTGVAMRYLDWLLNIVDRCAGPERLRPIYTVTGEELGSEADLSHLSGYRGSQPVRVGNAAAQQVQLDVFGPIVELVHLLAQAGAAISPDHWRLVEAMATAVERTWHEPDHGIWEIRTEKLHHIYSKAMCWLALDRASKLAAQFVGVQREHWQTLRDKIREEVLERGFSKRLNSFITAYDKHELDAACLTLGLFGLIPPSDPRFISTVDAVSSHLLEGGTVYRYRYDDDLPGPEGGFHLCTGWLIESFLAIGKRDKAEELFAKLCAAAGPPGILSEQWCPTEQTALGNIAQAYSHAALINSAVALSSSSPPTSAQ